ncbi:MAG: RidA family protein [Steroidobacteraceae bacterium]
MSSTLPGLIVAVMALLPATAGVAAAAGAAGSEPERSYVMADSVGARAQLPFSDAVRAGNTLYVSGTIGLDPATLSDPKTAHAANDPTEEARYALEAVKRTLAAAGYKMDDLVSVQVFCTDLDLYGVFNDVYRTYFHEHFPARAFIGVNQLVRGAHFEVMGTAVRGGR